MQDIKPNCPTSKPKSASRKHPNPRISKCESLPKLLELKAMIGPNVDNSLIEENECVESATEKGKSTLIAIGIGINRNHCAVQVHRWSYYRL
ncbi:hypothetical protein RJ641_035784 [Dillenia turbinata]|uniref:Uncharacterized protein n=1 Tax=Dillenia turbinata TaxID=194707 RepID=A0AAN8VPS8_9MAGN